MTQEALFDLAAWADYEAANKRARVDYFRRNHCATCWVIVSPRVAPSRVARCGAKECAK